MTDSDSECHLKELSKDLLADVMARLDGLSLAAVACTCTELQDLATETGLWESLCHNTWPSTASPVVKDIVPFDKFYAESRPLILYNDSVTNRGSSEWKPESFSESCARDLVSLVDVFYKGVCVLSKVIDGIPEAGNGVGVNQKWFADFPFELDVVKFDYSQGSADDEVEEEVEEDEVGDFSQELEEGVRLSWVILNKKSRKSVNVSSWKPLMVQKSWISSKNYTFQFGCVIPVEFGISGHEVVECVITARCELSSEGLKWEEIGMSIKDIVGAHLRGKKSLMVLNQAIYSARSTNTNTEDVRRGYERFEKMKKEIKRARDCKETLANGLCLSVEILIFAALYHTFFL